MKDLYSYLLNSSGSMTYSGLDAYVKPMLLRFEAKPKVIKQIINAERVAQFHDKTDKFVNKVISSRVEEGIAIKNLIRPEDKKYEIELSDADTLKETKLLPEDFVINSMFAVFDDYVTMTNLDLDNTFGVIVKDSAIAELMNSFFDGLWSVGEKV